MTLTDFLLARIAEDEAVAREREDDDLWRNGAYGWIGTYPTGEPIVLQVDPARVLAECEAKRRIVEEHALDKSEDGTGVGCERCDWDREWGMPATGGCDTLRALAIPYADRPDYDEEWKP